MDKFPLMQGCFSVGELITEQEALYTWFEARCRLPGEGLWCAWAVGDRGGLRLGVLEPCGDRATIRRRFSARLTAPLGKLRQGEIRPAHPPEPEDWTPLERSAVRLRSPWLREQLHLVPGVLVREEPGRREKGELDGLNEFKRGAKGVIEAGVLSRPADRDIFRKFQMMCSTFPGGMI